MFLNKDRTGMRNIIEFTMAIFSPGSFLLNLCWYRQRYYVLSETLEYSLLENISYCINNLSGMKSFLFLTSLLIFLNILFPLNG